MNKTKKGIGPFAKKFHFFALTVLVPPQKTVFFGTSESDFGQRELFSFFFKRKEMNFLFGMS